MNDSSGKSMRITDLDLDDKHAMIRLLIALETRGMLLSKMELTEDGMGQERVWYGYDTSCQSKIDRNKCPICKCIMDWNDEKKQYECNGVKPGHSLTLSPFWTSYLSLLPSKIEEKK